MGGSCLQIAGRTIARSDEGALAPAYALFDPCDIELTASEPGNVHEVGYRTTAARARARLSYAGIGDELARAAAKALAPIAPSYARGHVVRRVVAHLGATELFEGEAYDSAQEAFLGRWLDLAALARDADAPGAAMHLIHLAALLEDTPDDAVVMLHTEELTRGGRPSERTHRRTDFEAVPRTVAALQALASKPVASTAEERARGPSRGEMLEVLRERIAWCTRGEAPARLARIEAAVANVREQPTRGPLSDPVLWALERRMSDGDMAGVLEELEVIERAWGRTPTTAYLRSRASLILGNEDPGVVAARVSALAMSMSSFAELELLASQAWLAAGQPRRAAPYARDLLENAGLDPELRARAMGVLRAVDATAPSNVFEAEERVTPALPAIPLTEATAAPPRSAPTPLAPSPPASAKPTLDAGEAPVDPRAEPAPVVDLGAPPPMFQPAPSARPAPSPAAGGEIPPPSASSDPARTARVPPSAGERVARDSAEPRRSSPRSPIPEAAPTPVVRSPRHPPRSRPPPPPRAPGLVVESFDPRWSDRRAESDNAPSAPPTTGAISERGNPVSAPGTYMRGASQPLYRLDEGARADAPRGGARLNFAHSESAEYLSIPRGGAAAPSVNETPRTVPDARTLFTQLSRELGREYRVRRGVELRTDAHAIEAMQAHLFDSYYGRKVRALEDWLDVRRHGAFLSEILARTLGAEWVDISPSELGYWAMVVPGGTRIWPFARVLRYLAMGPKERDLVSYYLELKGRALGG